MRENERERERRERNRIYLIIIICLCSVLNSCTIISLLAKIIHSFTLLDNHNSQKCLSEIVTRVGCLAVWWMSHHHVHELKTMIHYDPNANSDIESETSVSTDTCSDDSEENDICTHNIL